MQTMKLKARIEQDGMLKLEVATGLSGGDVEVVLVVQPAQSPQVDAKGWPVGFFERIDSMEADDMIERPPQPPLEIRDPIE